MNRRDLLRTLAAALLAPLAALFGRRKDRSAPPVPHWLEGWQVAPPRYPQHKEVRIVDADTGEELQNAIFGMNLRQGWTLEWDEDAEVPKHGPIPKKLYQRRLIVEHPPTGGRWYSDDYA